MQRKKRNIHFQPVKPPKEKKSLNFFQFRHSWILYPALALVIIIAIAIASIALLKPNLPSLTELEQIDPMLVTRIYSSDGVLLKELYKEKRLYVPLERIPQQMVNALIATEDRRFYDHWGLDLKRIAGAILVDLRVGYKKEGASTLTQQLARHAYLTRKKSWVRKLSEQLTALQIERTYSKSEIIEMYLNRMELGRGAHGVQAAALAYFQKNVEDLQLHESALLVGLFQRPYGYAPEKYPELATNRRNVVLQNMASCNFITQAVCDSASLLPLDVVAKNADSEEIAPYFCENVRLEMEKRYGAGTYTDGYSIYTSLDTRVQACADSAINMVIGDMEKEIWTKKIKNRNFLKWIDVHFKSEEEIKAFLADSVRVDSTFRKAMLTLQTAFVAMNPQTGHVLAMTGGRDFNRWKYNRATQAKRQPGSAFKPIVYTTAIVNGYPPTYRLLNQPVVLMMLDGTRWSPQNHDGSTGGPTSLREALRRSLNLVSVRLLQEVIPPQEVVKYADRFGLTTEIHPYDAIALGADVVIPIELVAAYNVFANKGIYTEPVSILRVEDKDGNILEEATPAHKEVISEAAAYIMTDMLQGVLGSGGTGNRARWMYNFYRPAGGKTGTTNESTDAWFVGFIPQLTAGVWVGFDDQRISMGDKREGANTALPIWGPFMKMVCDTLHLPLMDFEQPPGVVRLKVCNDSPNEAKKLANSACPDVSEDLFLEELAPTEYCDIHTNHYKEKKSHHRVF